MKRTRAIFAAMMSATFALLPLKAYAAPHVLVWAGGIDINTLDPLMPGALPNVYLRLSTMAYLTTSGDGQPVPELAARIPTQKNGGISADGKTITFQLRPNLKWSDGAPLTSEDIAFTVALVNDPKTNIADLTGYRLITRVDTPNKTTAIIHLSQPYGPIVNSIFSDASAPVLPKHLLAGKNVNTADYMQLPVGAGPFRYTKWVRGDRVELGPNPFYFRDTPKLKTLNDASPPSPTAGNIVSADTRLVDTSIISATAPRRKRVRSIGEPLLRIRNPLSIAARRPACVQRLEAGSPLALSRKRRHTVGPVTVTAIS